MLKSASFQRSPADPATAVGVGQHFVEIGGKRRVVRVVAVIRPQSGVPHARLRPAGRRSGVTLISCAALRDRRSFLPLIDGRDPISVLIAGRFGDLARPGPQPNDGGIDVGRRLGQSSVPSAARPAADGHSGLVADYSVHGGAVR